MEQRVYRGSITPTGLAEHLVSHFDPQENLQAQKIGQAESWVVQIGHGDEPEERRHALSVAIARTPEGEVSVTLGQQQWITPQMATHSLIIGLVGLVITPWALFGLLFPLSQALAGTNLTNEVWEAVDVYVASQGGGLREARQLTHPQAS